MLTKKKTEKVRQTLLDRIRNYYNAGEFSKVLNEIDDFAEISARVNDVFRNDEIEDYLRNIGEKYIGKKSVKSDSNCSKKIVFYDQIGTTICLGLQYLRALKSLGYEILYIFEQNKTPIYPQLKDEVETICFKTAYYNQPYSIDTAKEIQRLIVDYRAPKLIAHSPCYGAMGSAIFYSLSEIEKYRVVPGDHHFYIGIDCIDHFIEFRDFGINISVNYRNIPIKKINRLLYYPIIESRTPFQGFPEVIKGKIVIAAAARERKFHGSDWFFNTCEYILKKYKNVIILFIGGDSKKVRTFVKERHLQDKFIILGYRTDFIECMKHIDIFFDSYPWGSALTSMTAAYFSCPIISYHDKIFELESLNSWIIRDDGIPVSYSNETELFDHIDKLIEDKEYRKKEGNSIKEALPTCISFTNGLQQILNGKQSECKYALLDKNAITIRSKMYIELQNVFNPLIINILFSKYHLHSLLIFPYLFIDSLAVLCKSKYSKTLGYFRIFPKTHL